MVLPELPVFIYEGGGWDVYGDGRRGEFYFGIGLGGMEDVEVAMNSGMIICTHCHISGLPATLGQLCTSCHIGTWVLDISRQDYFTIGDGPGDAPIYEMIKVRQTDCAPCYAGAHQDCDRGPDGKCCCFGTHPGYVFRAWDMACNEQVAEPDLAEEGQGGSVVVVQARPATRKVKRHLAKLGVSFLLLHCVPAKEGGCGLAVVVAASSLTAMRKAEEDGSRVDVVCDGCLERYLGMRRAVANVVAPTEDQVKEGSKIARILGADKRRN